ncbi:MAG TPA: DeoR/GlpR family DNA-binding transcription regulator [Rectinemataceae bacterium]|nr:DeoR/GlpR family DNA-binding transcription regulator [Rectinemataceae bacterium]
MSKEVVGKELLAAQRRERILELIQEEGSARVKVLGSIFKVSEPTIRQDLEKLESDGFVTREHGGAFLRTVSQQVGSLTLQHMENLDKKILIAKRAAQFVAPGNRIILDSGSTITELAKCVAGVENLTVITNAINIALIIGTNPSCELLVTGGEFKAPTLSLTGDKAAFFFRNLYVDKLFLATGGISSAYELTYPGFSDIVVKNSMIEVARETYLLADSTKFGKASFASLGSIRCVNYLITDEGIDPAIVKEISAMGVKVIIA